MSRDKVDPLTSTQNLYLVSRESALRAWQGAP
jgi:hypothetical protein